MSKIIERIALLIESEGISNRAFEISIGASNGMIGRAISKGTDISAEWLSKIIYAYPNVNSEWLLTGVGEKFKAKSTENPVVQNDRIEDRTEDRKRKVQKIRSNDTAEATDLNIFKLRTDRLIDRQAISIYDMEAVAGLVPLFTDSYSQQVVDVIETTLIPKCDGGLRIVGDSMYPLLKSGDVVFYKQIHDIRNNLIWGEMYLVSFDIEGDEYIVVKYLQRSKKEDHVTLVSYNTHHEPMEIHISRIRALALIKASLRLNSIK